MRDCPVVTHWDAISGSVKEEPSGPKGPQVEIKEVADVVLFLDVTAPRMRVSFWREMLLTVGSDRKVPQ